MDCFLEGTSQSVRKWLAIFSTALVFTLAHVQVSYTTPVGFLVVLLVLAIAWGWLMRKTGSLWGSALFHAGADLLIILPIFAVSARHEPRRDLFRWDAGRRIGTHWARAGNGEREDSRNQFVMTHRAEFAVVILGTIFVFIGVAASGIASVRRGNTGRILAWFGIFSALYGVRLFAAVPTAFSLLVGPFSSSAPQVVWIITYVIMIPALLFWAELTVGTLRRIAQIMVIPASAIAIAGTASVLLHQSPIRFMPYNNVLVIGSLLAVAIANVVPRIGKQCLLIQSRVSAAGTLILAAAVVHDNLNGTFLNLRSYPFLEPLAFALFVLSQGWVAARKGVCRRTPPTLHRRRTHYRP